MSENTLAVRSGKSSVAERGARTRFKQGNPGRPKGIPDKRTLAQRELLELFSEGWSEDKKPAGVSGPLTSRPERIRRLLESDDESIRIDAEKWLASYEWARPKVTLEVSGSVNVSALILAAFARTHGNGNGNGNGASSPR